MAENKNIIPKISIIMPMYNQKDYIEECLLSVIKQTLNDIEILVVNDGSTDNSLEIVKNLAKNDNRIKIIDKPNAGYGNSMNMGLDKATGEYIGIVETDDFVAKDMFEKLYSLTNNGTVDVVKSNFYDLYEHSDGTYDEFINEDRNNAPVLDHPFNIREYPHILWGHPSVWSGIYRRQFLLDHSIKFIEAKGGGWVDNPFFYETLCNAKSIMWTNEPFYHYRRTTANSSSNGVINPNLPFERMNDNLDILERTGYNDDISLKYAYSRALMYATGAYKECGFDVNFDTINKNAKQLMQRCNPDIFQKYFNDYDQYNYLKMASPLQSISADFPKILIYNWLPFDNPWHWGGGVTIYCKNLIEEIIKDYPTTQIYFISSGFAYSAETTNTFIRKIDNIFGNRCHQFEIVNSPIPADQRNMYVNPTLALKNNKLKNVFKNFIDKFGPFKAIHFNNIEGLSLDVFDLKKDYKDTKFIFSIHNYIPMCLTSGYYQRHNHCVCNPNHTAEDCFNCSRADIKTDIAKETYIKGLYNLDRNNAIPYDKWINELGISDIDKDVTIEHILDFAKTATNKINKNCDKVLAVSKRVYDIAAANGFDESKMKVSYIGTKVAREQVRKSLCPIGDTLKLVFLGSDLYYEEKGYPFLLDALQSINYEYASKIDLVLTMRQTDDDETIKERLKNFNSIKIIHGYNHDDLRFILKDCNLSVVPVLWEDNLPQISIESVAYGVPVLSSDFGGASELCSSKLFKFTGGDKQDFINKLCHFVDNPQDLQEYWNNHNGLVTMQQHCKEIINIYGLPENQKDITISPRDLYFLFEENKFLSEHITFNQKTTLSEEDRKKIDTYNKNVNLFNFFQEEQIYDDGVYVKFIRKINKMFPKNSKIRNFLKKIF